VCRPGASSLSPGHPTGRVEGTLSRSVVGAVAGSAGLLVSALPPGIRSW
jgi:hypothetical protein